MPYQAKLQDQLPSTPTLRRLQGEITRPYLAMSNPDPTSSRSPIALTHQYSAHRDEHRDVIMPDPSVLRRMLHVSDSVAEIMASYEAKRPGLLR